MCPHLIRAVPRICFVSSVSPEGSMAINDRIAKHRAEAIADWISREINVEVGYNRQGYRDGQNREA